MNRTLEQRRAVAALRRAYPGHTISTRTRHGRVVAYFALARHIGWTVRADGTAIALAPEKGRQPITRAHIVAGEDRWSSSYHKRARVGVYSRGGITS